jgi:hypothetical protein
MSTEQTPQLPAAITGKFNIALTQAGFQKLADKANSLVYTEDNLEAIALFLKDLRKVEKAINETHKEGKSEALKIGRDWDAAKNTFLSQLESVESLPQSKYTKLCQDIEERKRKEALEFQRKENIKQGIENNSVLFAKKIAECTTTQQLTEIERLINLEKSRKEKYMEFLDEAVIRFTELNTLLKDQKETVRKLEEIKRQEEEAIKEQDDEKILQLQQQKEEAEAKIEENKVVVQETAINQSMNTDIPVAKEVFPTISARRTTWKYEMVSEKEVMKKAPELLVVSLDDDKVKQTLKTLKDTKQLEGKTELVLNGIRYFEVKTY